MSSENNIPAQPGYELFPAPNGGIVKAWTRGVPFEEQAKKQVLNSASLPFVHKWVAIMPDVHLGIGATIGSVIPTKGAIIPAAVGVDIGCGMMAVKTSLTASDLPESLTEIRSRIETAVPHGFNSFDREHQRGGWNRVPERVAETWAELEPGFKQLTDKYPRFKNTNHIGHLGTLGTGNHFIEICLDEANAVWIMLHSGSRGVGNKIGTFFIELAREDMRKWMLNLPDRDLAYFPEGTDHFDDYVHAVEWAQRFAACNRETMMRNIVHALGRCKGIPPFSAEVQAVNCHHNYVAREHHFGENVFVTRKGAVRAREGEMGIIPGSMGACSYIVRGKGNPESFHSCSHGAGRLMSRTEAKRRFTVRDHELATQGVECRKDKDVIDETPAAYKPIDAVMEAQRDLVEIVHTLKQVVCVKG
jgi:tRNA-splicing ligase RtcB (3'-phosphate/5'-hydroxy nucleic acid ligase)